MSINNGAPGNAVPSSTLREIADGARAVTPNAATAQGAHIEKFVRVSATGERRDVDRTIADEAPIAIEYNGIGYAVLMASAIDLVDLAHGFTFAERLALHSAEILGVDVHAVAAGHVIRVALDRERIADVVERVRHRVSESSCGMCGIENLEQALRPLPMVTQQSLASDAAIFRALASLRQRQPLNERTGAVHAAALVAVDGTISVVREDVGRHNALDKLIGAMRRQGLGWDGGFAILTSRCSYELVEKAALANCPLLVTISAPTGLAVARARAAGLRLGVLARSDSILFTPRGNELATGTAI